MRDDIHVIDPNWEHGLALLQEHIRRAPTITFEIVSSVIARGCLRFHVQNPAAKARAARLIESSAFADAALTLLELEMPQWTIRRLVYDEGRWHCSLSKQAGVPCELDSMVEADHPVLSFAILSALVDARRFNVLY